ncbi:tripartite tricarboxylate transporter substrate binding protein [Pararoseomonas sp. SCSIO 73927]|uniref:tripartite tricarboxylate transporter substrate binding protein n=1 Tax=Pararoseomonas sp. SCSIO 73927 TaxID=3114537 RepID=UPI0030D1458F
MRDLARGVPRRGLLAGAALAPLAPFRPRAARAAEAWPRGLTTSLVVPYTPGGPTDVMARLLATGLAERLGGSFVVENRPGASTTLAARQVTRGRPDGSLLFLGTIATFANAPHMFRQPGYDPVAGFTHVTLLVDSLYVLVANPKWGSLAEVLEASRRGPGAVSYASQGIGTTGHLPMVDLAARAGVEWVHAPYTGSPQALTDLIAGRTDLMFALLGAAKASIDEGRVRPLGIALPERSPTLPGVPTLAEGGFPGFAAGGWFSLQAPPGMPEAQGEALSAATAATIAGPAMRDFLNRNGLIPMEPGPGPLRARLEADLASQGELIRRAGIRPE